MIRRDPGAAAGAAYDLIVIGGGVHGVALTLEAARRGFRPLLLERGDFGGATSWNSMRIVHGGLRYLHSLDLPRFRESVAERRWFLREFPDLVRPFPILMPLYGRGLRRASVLRAVLAMNDLLSRGRNQGVEEGARIPDGRVLSREETLRLAPVIREEGLEGGALWYDALMRSSIRLVMEMLRWACHAGAAALNHVEATSLLTEHGRVRGVEGVDRVTGDKLEFRAPVVVNCAGPWVAALAGRFDRPVPRLFAPSLAFNVLVHTPAPVAPGMLAVSAPRPGARTYFMYGSDAGLWLGTYHDRWSDVDRAPRAEERQIQAMVDDVNEAIPGAGLHLSGVRRVLAGLLPAKPGTDETVSRSVIHDHGRHGGPAGLFSVSGIKFTTARRVAEAVLRIIVARCFRTDLPTAAVPRPPAATVPAWPEFERLAREDPGAAAEQIGRIAREEAVVAVDDLLLRRTEWGLDPEIERIARPLVESMLARAGHTPCDLIPAGE